MDKQNLRNMVLAGVLTVLILFGWDAVMKHYYPNMNKAPVAAASAPADSSAAVPVAPATTKPTREGGLTDAADQALEAKDLASALNLATRVAIAAPGLTGSINLLGGVVDDLSTARHTASVDVPARRSGSSPRLARRPSSSRSSAGSAPIAPPMPRCPAVRPNGPRPPGSGLPRKVRLR